MVLMEYPRNEGLFENNKLLRGEVLGGPAGPERLQVSPEAHSSDGCAWRQ